MKDENMSYCFEAARKLLEKNPIIIVIDQLGVIREFISIIAKITTLVAMTSRKSMPIFMLTCMIPITNKFIGLILHKDVYSGLSNYSLRVS
jgi:hypothetical protein